MQSSLQVETDKHFFAAKGEGYDAIMHSHVSAGTLQAALMDSCVLPISNAEGCLEGQTRIIRVQSQVDVLKSFLCTNY